MPESSLLPQAVGRVSLALALKARDAWLADPDADPGSLIDTAIHQLHDYLQARPPREAASPEPACLPGT
jgi:hypothetical protein